MVLVSQSLSCVSRSRAFSVVLLGVLSGGTATTGAAQAQVATPSTSGAFQQIHLQDAWAKTGGDSDDEYGSVVLPAGWSAYNDYVIAVGAVDADDHLSSVSNYGNAVTITAPAVNIVSTAPGGGYAFDIAGGNGYTSFATPQVAAAIAMYWSQHPDVPFSTVRSALLNSADHIGGLPVLNGNRLNIGRMLTEY